MLPCLYRHQAGPFSDVSDFGERIVEFEGADGFVEGVAWSPNGHQLAFVGTFVQGKPQPNPRTGQ